MTSENLRIDGFDDWQGRLRALRDRIHRPEYSYREAHEKLTSLKAYAEGMTLVTEGDTRERWGRLAMWADAVDQALLKNIFDRAEELRDECICGGEADPGTFDRLDWTPDDVDWLEGERRLEAAEVVEDGLIRTVVWVKRDGGRR